MIEYFPTKYWHELEDGRVQCDLCPHECKLKEDQHGLCFVRMRHDNKVVLTTYGRSSGFAIDPVEKKPLNNFLPGTPVLSFGTAGCNLSCKFCQNWDISKARVTDILAVKASPKTIAETAKKLNCLSVAFTYNEPIIFMEYAIDTAIECHKLGIKTIAVTNGYISEKPREEFFSYMDAVRVDLKSFTEEFYSKITGSHLKPVLDTLYYLHNKTKVWLEVICLIIPGENDSEEELDKETKWIKENLGESVPVHYSGFFPAWKMLDKPPTSVETLHKAREIAMRNGLRYVYTGNVYDREGSGTYCHNCKLRVIDRIQYEITSYELTDEGNCKFCGTKCAGVFAGPRGKWGQKSIPVKISD